MKLNFLKYALLIVTVLSFGFVSAQQISGAISNENALLSEVTVILKGRTNGAFADFEGNYTIKAPNNLSGEVITLNSGLSEFSFV